MESGGPQTLRSSRGNGMDAGIFDCAVEWEALLPPGTRPVRRAEELEEHLWPLLALTPGGCRALEKGPGGAVTCRVLIAPGDCRALPERVRAEAVVTCGLSPRDSLTLSSLAEPVLCVQRALPRPDGGTIEPQEFPLPALPGPAAELLPLLGLWLLRMPLTEGRFPWYSQVEKRGQGGPG